MKTKKWLEEKGYYVEYLEKHQRIVDRRKRIIWIKKDLFGADLLAMNGEEIIFANAVFGRKNIASHIKEFLKYPFPPFVKRWVVVWEKRVKEPEIVEVNDE